MFTPHWSTSNGLEFFWQNPLWLTLRYVALVYEKLIPFFVEVAKPDLSLLRFNLPEIKEIPIRTGVGHEVRKCFCCRRRCGSVVSQNSLESITEQPDLIYLPVRPFGARNQYASGDCLWTGI